jgi:hypothetical protein
MFNEQPKLQAPAIDGLEFVSDKGQWTGMPQLEQDEARHGSHVLSVWGCPGVLFALMTWGKYPTKRGRLAQTPFQDHHETASQVTK